jgi:hypothetical protein
VYAYTGSLITTYYDFLSIKPASNRYERPERFKLFDGTTVEIMLPDIMAMTPLPGVAAQGVGLFLKGTDPSSLKIEMLEDGVLKIAVPNGSLGPHEVKHLYSDPNVPVSSKIETLTKYIPIGESGPGIAQYLLMKVASIPGDFNIQERLTKFRETARCENCGSPKKALLIDPTIPTEDTIPSEGSLREYLCDDCYSKIVGLCESCNKEYIKSVGYNSVLGKKIKSLGISSGSVYKCKVGKSSKTITKMEGTTRIQLCDACAETAKKEGRLSRCPLCGIDYYLPPESVDLFTVMELPKEYVDNFPPVIREQVSSLLSKMMLTADKKYVSLAPCCPILETCSSCKKNFPLLNFHIIFHLLETNPTAMSVSGEENLLDSMSNGVITLLCEAMNKGLLSIEESLGSSNQPLCRKCYTGKLKEIRKENCKGNLFINPSGKD